MYSFFCTFLDPENERIQNNFEVFAQALADRNISAKENTTNNNIKLNGEGSNPNKRRKKRYHRFHYTADENEGVRYLMEKKRSQELCRGETEPIVSL